MITPIHSPLKQNINFQGAKLPSKTVIITSKEGKDEISDVFVGGHLIRENIIDWIIRLLTTGSRKL